MSEYALEGSQTRVNSQIFGRKRAEIAKPEAPARCGERPPAFASLRPVATARGTETGEFCPCSRGLARSHSAPTKCHEPSDSTARWGSRSCMAAKGHHSPAFEQGQATSTSSSNLPNDAGPSGVGSSSTSPMLTHFTNARSQRDTSRLLCPAMPNGVSASSTKLTPTATNSVSLSLCFRFPSNSGSKRQSARL